LNKAKILILPTHHFDLIWRKPVEEYRSIRRDVIHRLLDLLEEFPEFKVTLVQGLALMNFLEDSPKDRNRLVRFIGEGRLEVAWGGLTLIDQGVICGESIVRNLLYGKMWLKDELGANVKTANFSDAFGINGQIPQIIRGFGVDSLTGARMSRAVGRMHLGNYGGFTWEGLDGSGVIVYENALGALPVEHMGIFYGWGILEGYDDLYRQYTEGTLAVDMKGGVEAIFKTLDSIPGDPVPIMVSAETHMPSRGVVAEVLDQAGSHGAKFAVQSEYIERLRKENLPVISGEFNPELTGCYSSRTSFKQYNRRVERNLLSAEMLSSLLEVNGTPRPQSTRDIWTRLALAQFHDSLGGCIDDESGLFVESRFKELLSDTGELCRSELMRAAYVCSTEGPGDEALVVFDPSPHRTEGCVFIPGADGMVPVDGQGRGIPAQRVDGGILAEMPLSPSAISVCWLRPGEAELAAVSTDGIADKDMDYYNVQAAFSGLHVECKESGGNLFKGLPHLILMEDKGTLWCEEYTGREASVMPALSSVEDGPLTYTLVYRGATEARLWEGFERLSYTLRLTFFKHSPRIGLDVSLDWAGKNTKIVLKLPFDYPGGVWTATHSVPFGSVMAGL
jgi:alpha-mannosidase